MGNGYKLQTFNLFITSFWYTTFCELGESHMCLLHESFKKIYVLQLTVKRQAWRYKMWYHNIKGGGGVKNVHLLEWIWT